MTDSELKKIITDLKNKNFWQEIERIIQTLPNSEENRIYYLDSLGEYFDFEYPLGKSLEEFSLDEEASSLRTLEDVYSFEKLQAWKEQEQKKLREV